MLTKTKDAKMQSEITEIKEKAKLDIEAWKTEKLSNNRNINLNDSIVKEILTQHGSEYAKESGDSTFKTIKSGYEIAYTDLYKENSSNLGDSSTNTPSDPLKPPETTTTVTQEVITANTIFKENTKMKDANGKEVTIPADFKLAGDIALTVDEGIVIDDGTGNQFVWIPVENASQYVRNTEYEWKNVSQNTMQTSISTLPTRSYRRNGEGNCCSCRWILYR